MQQWKQDKRMMPGKVIPKVGQSCIFVVSTEGALRIPMITFPTASVTKPLNHQNRPQIDQSRPLMN